MEAEPMPEGLKEALAVWEMLPDGELVNVPAHP